jgi:uncharacterized protein DUF3631
VNVIKRKPTAQGDTNGLLQVTSIFAKHVDAKPHYLVGMALWALHTHIYNHYNKTPRLAILSPVRNCGKSTVLDILGAMVWNHKSMNDPTAPSIFRLANNHTLLIDEMDNMTIVKGMRSILNDGHSAGGCVPRVAPDGTVISYPVYGPVALAGIGRLPATLMSRSLVIRLHRSNKPMDRFIARDQYFVSQLSKWARQVDLNPDPRMPVQLIGRDADKWRPLIAIADSFGQGEMARKVAVEFTKESDSSDPRESVLRDTEKVFKSVKTDLIPNDVLYQKLKEDKDSEFEVDYTERRITKNMISNYLRDFQIRNKPHRYKGGTVARCWFREDFEEMWKRYS